MILYRENTPKKIHKKANLWDTRSTCESCFCFYTPATHTQKRNYKCNFIASKNKPRNKFNQGGESIVYQKLLNTTERN